MDVKTQVSHTLRNDHVDRVKMSVLLRGVIN